MNRAWFYRIVAGLGCFAAFLYAYVVHHNRVLQLQMDIPKIAKEVREIEQDNIRLRFKIQQFEDPSNLMKTLAMKEYLHLEYAASSDVRNLRVSPWPYSTTIDNTFVNNRSSSWVNSLGASLPN